MRTRQIVVMVAAVMFVVMVMGCGSAPAANNSSGTGGSSQSGRNATQTSVVLGKNGIPMPEWAAGRTPPETGDAMYFVTQGGKVGTLAGKASNALSFASGEAAVYINSKTDVLIKNYIELAGEGDNVQSLQSLRTGIITRASSNTSGIKREEYWEAADDEYYGLYAFDKVVFRGDIREEVNTFQRNSAAAAANFEANIFFEEMERTLGIR